jgi:multiple sugar transport system substrate-binding protein
MNQTPADRRLPAAVAALALGGLLAACGSSGKAASGPATLTYWGWNQGQAAAVKAFNAAHKDVQIKYTKITDSTAPQQLTNAFKAGNAPCLMQSTAEYVTTYVSQGMLGDISTWIAPHKAQFNAGAYAGTLVQGKAYGVATSSSPAFTIYRADVFKKYGIAPPATWDGLIAAGKVLKSHGVHITNYAGEDPSTLETLAMQAGAHWYSIQGNAWKVNFQDPATLRAAAVIQQIIDNGLDSSISFADYAAVQRNYDTGGTVTRQISTWQMAGMVKNFKKSLGQWAIAPWPTFSGAGLRTPAGTNKSGGVNLVTAQCKYRAQAAQAALWLSTDPGAVKIMADPATGDGLMPAVIDATPYVDSALPKTLLGGNYDAAKKVVTDSFGAVDTDWTFGPDWTAMYTELATGWAKVMTEQQKVTDLLAHMQRWTVGDLKSRGISVEG